jgi:bifunctional DNA-binding transcriptional regulator/antitoxin component of YhaV-PrlF toxin-antitoxin module
MNNPKFITTCEEDENGDLVLAFPEELLDAMGWGDGTFLDIDVLGDRIIIREVRPDTPEETGVSS